MIVCDRKLHTPLFSHGIDVQAVSKVTDYVLRFEKPTFVRPFFNFEPILILSRLVSYEVDEIESSYALEALGL